MAKKNQVTIDILVNGKMQKATVSANALKKALDGVDATNKKAAKSTGTLDRNMKGASQASANVTKNFSKMAQGSGGIAAIYAQIAAQVFAVSAAFQFLKNAADTSKLIKGQEALGAVTGVAFKSLTADIQAATGGQLAYAEAAQAAAIGTAAGLTASQLEGLGKAARNASAALGRDLTDSFNRLVRGVTKAEPELLDELGIILRLKDATEEYALSVGKNADELSTYERSQAVTNNVLGQAEEKFGKIAKIMDPGAEALNRFLTSFDELLISIKTGVIDALRPVFDFLANNTNSLVTVFAALSALIVKSLIPNFGNYAKQAGGAAFAVKRQLVEQRKELQKLAEAARIAALSQKELAAESVKALTAATGITGKEGGRGALDFLSGASDEKGARTNAKKALDHYHSQTLDLEKGSIDKRTGLLAKYNEDQVAMMDKTLAHRIAVLDKEEDATAASTAAQGGSYDMLYLKAKLEATKFGAWLLKWGGRLASALQVVLIVGAFAGAFVAIATILYDLGKAILNFFNPAKKGAEEALKAAEDYSSGLNKVNEELDRMVEVRRDVGLTLTEMVTQSGNAASSSDIANRATELLKLKKAFEGGLIEKEVYDEAVTGFKRLLTTTDELIPGLVKTQQAFIDTQDPLKIDIDAINKLTQAAIEAGQAVSALAQARERMAQAEASFIGVSVDPLEALISAQREVVKQQNATTGGIRTKRNQNNTNLLFRARAAGEEANRLKSLPTRTFQVGLLGGTMSERRAEQKRQVKEQLDLQTRLRGQLAAHNEELRLSEDLRDKEQLKLNELVMFQIDYNVAVDKARTKRENLATQMELEFSTQNKINNLKLQKNNMDDKEFDLAARIAYVKMQEKDADGDKKKTYTQQRIELEHQLAVMEGQNDFKQKQLQLEIDIATIQNELGIDEINREEKLIALRAQQLGQVEKLAAAHRKILDIRQEQIQMEVDREMLNLADDSPFKGFVFNEAEKRQKLELDAQIKINNQKKLAAAMEKDIAQLKLDLERKQFELAQKRAKVDLASFNIRSGKKREELDKDGLTGDQAELFNELNSLATQAFSAQELTIDKVYKNTLEKLDLANDKLQRQKEQLTDVGQIAQAAGQAFEEGFVNAFSSVIQGTQSFKQAFASMTQSVLQMIAQMIARLIAMKLIEMTIQSFMFAGGAAKTQSIDAGMGGMGAQGGMPGSGGLGSTGGPRIARYGGVFSNGKDVPGYSAGGIARGPHAGYPAMLHGTEAVVPLPNNKSIPVDIKGAAGQMNNVTVNVAMENNGQTAQTTEGDSQGMDIGKAIAGAVQRELQNQKRAGGILSPYGVA